MKSSIISINTINSHIIVLHTYVIPAWHYYIINRYTILGNKVFLLINHGMNMNDFERDVYS